MVKIAIIPDNVCCDRITMDVESGVLHNVQFEGGCPGNGLALARLLEGMGADRAMELLAGVDCDGKGTSCADQLSRGLRENVSRAEPMEKNKA